MKDIPFVYHVLISGSPWYIECLFLVYPVPNPIFQPPSIFNPTLQFTYSYSITEGHTFCLPLPLVYHVLIFGLPWFTKCLFLVYPVPNPIFQPPPFSTPHCNLPTHIQLMKDIPFVYLSLWFATYLYSVYHGKLIASYWYTPFLPPFFYPQHFQPAHSNLPTQIQLTQDIPFVYDCLWFTLLLQLVYHGTPCISTWYTTPFFLHFRTPTIFNPDIAIYILSYSTSKTYLFFNSVFVVAFPNTLPCLPR